MPEAPRQGAAFGLFAFQPVAVDPNWQAESIMALVRGIHKDQAFDRLPTLADALQDAGCDEEQVLKHCRDKSVSHEYGRCWVVDIMLLGKGIVSDAEPGAAAAGGGM